jgi:hypothetical protein
MRFVKDVVMVLVFTFLVARQTHMVPINVLALKCVVARGPASAEPQRQLTASLVLHPTNKVEKTRLIFYLPLTKHSKSALDLDFGDD